MPWTVPTTPGPALGEPGCGGLPAFTVTREPVVFGPLTEATVPDWGRAVEGSPGALTATREPFVPVLVVLVPVVAVAVAAGAVAVPVPLTEISDPFAGTPALTVTSDPFVPVVPVVSVETVPVPV
jgi:hypothetical protein